MQPSDALFVRVPEILTRDWGIAGHGPGKRAISGVLAGEPDDVRDEYLIPLPLDRGRGVWRFGERVDVPLAPFMGVLGVALEFPGRTSALRAGPHGGNMDCKQWGVGATRFLPVHVPGALFSVGDGHGVQGDGEVEGAAIETGMERLVLEFGLRKGAPIRLPRAETETCLIPLAFNEDLDVAVLEAARDVIGYLKKHHGLTHHEDYTRASIGVYFRISQVVDGLKGVHAMLLKTLFEQNTPLEAEHLREGTRLSSPLAVS